MSIVDVLLKFSIIPIIYPRNYLPKFVFPDAEEHLLYPYIIVFKNKKIVDSHTVLHTSSNGVVENNFTT